VAPLPEITDGSTAADLHEAKRYVGGIARRIGVRSDLMEDSVSEGLIALLAAQKTGAPLAASVRNRIIDFYRRHEHSRCQDRPTFESIGERDFPDPRPNSNGGPGTPDRRRNQKDAVAGQCRLSLRQSQILDHLLAGRRNKEIASALGVTVKTIDSHCLALYRKLGVRSRGEVFGISRERESMVGPQHDDLRLSVEALQSEVSELKQRLEALIGGLQAAVQLPVDYSALNPPRRGESNSRGRSLNSPIARASSA